LFALKTQLAQVMLNSGFNVILEFKDTVL